MRAAMLSSARFRTFEPLSKDPATGNPHPIRVPAVHLVLGSFVSSVECCRPRAPKARVFPVQKPFLRHQLGGDNRDFQPTSDSWSLVRASASHGDSSFAVYPVLILMNEQWRFTHQ